MDDILKQVRRAQRRLALERFLGALGWCWFVALSIAAVLITVDKWRPLGVDAWVWAAGALAAGFLAAGAWTIVRTRGPLAAAMEIDRRFGLKERLSSSLGLPADERETEVARALVEDASRRARRIDVGERFAVRPKPWVLLPLLPGVAAALVAILVSPAVVEQPAQAGPQDGVTQEQIKKSTESLRRKLAERRREAEKQGLEDAERLFRRLEEGARDLRERETDRKNALVELNDLNRQLEARRDKLGGAEQMKQQLDQLKNVERGPADEFAKALSKGDFQKAAQELEKLKNELAQSKLDDKRKEQLAEQLDRLKQQIEKTADAHEAARNDLQNQIDRLRQAGQPGEADRLQEQLDKLLQQMPQVEQLQDLAEKLGQCSKCMKDGQMQDAQDALGGLKADLDGLQQQLDELQMIEEAMNQIAQAREQMTCKACMGAGCGECQGEPGFGMGPGQGQGERPIAEDETQFYDSQVRPKIGEGMADVVDLVDGPNIRGNVADVIQQEYEATRQGSTDPLSGRQIPREARDHAKEYFDRFREGR